MLAFPVFESPYPPLLENQIEKAPLNSLLLISGPHKSPRFYFNHEVILVHSLAKKMYSSPREIY